MVNIYLSFLKLIHIPAKYKITAIIPSGLVKFIIPETSSTPFAEPYCEKHIGIKLKINIILNNIFFFISIVPPLNTLYNKY